MSATLLLFTLAGGGGITLGPMGYLNATVRFRPGATGRIAASWDACFVGADNLLELTQLTEMVSGELQEGATVTATFLTAAGAASVGYDDVPLTADEDTPGTYRANVPASELALVAGERYVAVVTVRTAEGVRARFTQPFEARERAGRGE